MGFGWELWCVPTCSPVFALSAHVLKFLSLRTVTFCALSVRKAQQCAVEMLHVRTHETVGSKKSHDNCIGQSMFQTLWPGLASRHLKLARSACSTNERADDEALTGPFSAQIRSTLSL